MKIQLSIIFFLVIFTSNSQSTSVEKSIYGIQTGVLGIWGYREVKLSRELALREELGFDTGIFGGSFYPKTGYLIVPVLTLEPRWYYNLEKRHSNSKSIAGNSGNFLSLQTSFRPNWFSISNYENIKIVNQISVIPTWGIRRNLGKHFNFETGIGLGVRYYFAKNQGYINNVSKAAINLNLRVGYNF